MSLTLSKETEQLVQAEVANSRLNSADDVITEALELYKQREQYLEEELQQGIEDMKDGRSEPYSPKMLDNITEMALKMMAHRKSNNA